MEIHTFELSNWIFTIGIEKSWREVNVPEFYPASKRNNCVCINGVIYCLNVSERGYLDPLSVGDENLIRYILFPDEVRMWSFNFRILTKNSRNKGTSCTYG